MMKRVMVALIAGTVLSGLAAAYASANSTIVDNGGEAAKRAIAKPRPAPGN